MSIRLYWDYYYKDRELEKAIAQDPEEVQPVWGLLEGRIVDGGSNVAISEMSKFIIDQYEKIYEVMISIFLCRCWRFRDCYVIYEAEDFTHPTLIVRRSMLTIPLPKDVQNSTDRAIDRAHGDKWKVVNLLREDCFKSFSESLDFETRLAWDIYRYRAFEQYEATTLVVEDTFTDDLWQDVNKRIRSAKKVQLARTADMSFTANGSSGKYEVDLLRMKCSCPDFRHRGRKYGVHCKHLVAALKESGLWERYWGKYIPV